MLRSDWSSDVCSSDLDKNRPLAFVVAQDVHAAPPFANALLYTSASVLIGLVPERFRHPPCLLRILSSPVLTPLPDASSSPFRVSSIRTPLSHRISISFFIRKRFRNASLTFRRQKASCYSAPFVLPIRQGFLPRFEFREDDPLTSGTNGRPVTTHYT